MNLQTQEKLFWNIQLVLKIINTLCQCMLLISSNTLQQVKKLKELEVAFTSDGGWKKHIDTWIVLASAVLCQLYHSVFTKSFQTPKSCQVLEWFLFWSSHEMFMNLGQCLNDCYLNYKQKRWHFCKEFMVWHIVTKCTVVIVIKIWISNHFANREIRAVLGIALRKHQTRKHTSILAISQKFWYVTENCQLLLLSSVNPVVWTNAGQHLDSRNFPHTLGYVYHKYQVCNLPYNSLHAHALFLALLIGSF